MPPRIPSLTYPSLRPSSPSPLASRSSTRPSRQSPISRPFSSTPKAQARLIPRPHRPYQFTQLLTLSDGSAFLHRTTSPLPVYRSTRDTRNSPLWNPSDSKLRNLETDETGRLRAFRKRFGRGWDSKAEAGEEVLVAGDVGVTSSADGSASASSTSGTSDAPSDQKEGAQVKAPSATSRAQNREETSSWSGEDEDDNLMDLISSFDGPAVGPKGGVVSARTGKNKGTGKKK